jgi:hypothetical protein
VEFAVFVAYRSFHTGAGQGSPGGHALIGSWRVAGVPVGAWPVPGRPGFDTIETYTADGPVIDSGIPLHPAPTDSPYKLVFYSAGHGTWESTGERSAIVTFVRLMADEDGNALGTLTIRVAAEVGVDGQTFSGTFVTTAVDPAGAVLVAFPGTLEATRRQSRRERRSDRPCSGLQQRGRRPRSLPSLPSSLDGGRRTAHHGSVATARSGAVLSG